MKLNNSLDAIGGIAVSPFERFCLLVVFADVAHDFAAEIVLRSEDSAGDQIALDFGEPDFDLVEPGGIGWRVMKADLGMRGQELPHLGGLVCGKVVHDQVELLLWWLREHQVLEKGDELGTGVARGRLAKDLSAGRIQSRVERERSVPVVLKAVTLGPTRRKRQHRIQPIQSLDGGLLIDAEDRSVSGRFEVKADDRRRLVLKVGIIAGHVAPQTVRLQTGFGPDTDYARLAGRKPGRQLAAAPMRRAIGRGAMQRPIDNARIELLGSYLRLTTRMTAPQSAQPIGHKTIAPQPHRIDAGAYFSTQLPDSLRCRQTQNDPCASAVFDPQFTAARHALKLSPFGRTKNKRCSHPSVPNRCCVITQ